MCSAGCLSDNGCRLLRTGRKRLVQMFLFTEQGVHRQLAFRLFLLEILDAVHLDLYELFLLKHLEI